MIELEERTETEGPARPKTPQETLLAAARYIEEHGWCQGNYSNESGVCVFGALNAVSTGHPSVPSFDQRPGGLLVRAIGGSVVDFNDRDGRTEAEVIAALRKAATL